MEATLKNVDILLFLNLKFLDIELLLKISRFPIFYLTFGNFETFPKDFEFVSRKNFFIYRQNNYFFIHFNTFKLLIKN